MAKLRKIRRERDWVARDAQQAVLAAVLIVLVIAGSLVDGRLIPDFANPPDKTKAITTGPDDDLKTGSIYITPSDGNVCEHRLIDNATWRIRPNGVTNCDGVVSWAAQEGSRNATARIEAIRDGFVQKPAK